jgi:hypothetical protein
LALIVRAEALVTMEELSILLLLLAFLPLIRCPPQERLYLTLPEAVILTLLVKPLWVFCFGIY